MGLRRWLSASFQGKGILEGMTCVWQLVQPGAPRSEQVVRTLLVCYKGIDQAMPCCKVWLDGATARTVTGSRGSTLLQCMLVRGLQSSPLLHLSEPGLLPAICQSGARPTFAMLDAKRSVQCLQALGHQSLEQQPFGLCHSLLAGQGFTFCWTQSRQWLCTEGLCDLNMHAAAIREALAGLCPSVQEAGFHPCHH